MVNWQKIIYDDVISFRLIDENNKVLIVPEDENNRHYQEYIAWIAEGNEPEVIND